MEYFLIFTIVVTISCILLIVETQIVRGVNLEL